MRLTNDEKASRYDSLIYSIKCEKDNLKTRLAKTERELENISDENPIAGLLIGRKYAYIEFGEILERWC